MAEPAQALDVEEKMLQYLEREEAQGEPANEEESEEVKAEETESEEEPVEEEPTEEEPTETLTWNGEEKVVSKAELKELAQKGFDYTQKTQAVANERKALEQERQVLEARAQYSEKSLDLIGEVKAIDRQLEQYSKVDWATLAEQNPVEYLKHNHAYRDLKEFRGVKAAEFEQIRKQEAEATARYLQEKSQAEFQKLTDRIPDFRDPQKATDLQTRMKGYLGKRGFSQAEIESVIDSRMVEVIYDALRYAGVQDAKPALTKRLEKAPKMMNASNVGQAAEAANRQKMRLALKKSGNSELAAKLIEGIL